MDNKERFWHPSRLQRDNNILMMRAKVKREIGAFFAKDGFIEVETPSLQLSPGMEPHIAAFKTQLKPAGLGFAPDEDETGKTIYLHTSPEFSMKKLLAGGLPRIWQLCKTYRNGEFTPLHQAEFTMLEWYRAEMGEDEEEARVHAAEFRQSLYHNLLKWGEQWSYDLEPIECLFYSFYEIFVSQI